MTNNIGAEAFLLTAREHPQIYEVRTFGGGGGPAPPAPPAVLFLNSLSLFRFRVLLDRLLLNFAAKYCKNSRDFRRGKKEHHDLETMEGMIHLWAFNAPPPPPPPIPPPTHITQKIKNKLTEFRRGYLYIHVEYHHTVI